MGRQRDVGDAPLITEYGFDRSVTNFEGLGPRVLPLCDARDGTPPRRHDLGSAGLEQGPVRWEDRSTVTSGFVKAALDFIDQAASSGTPFFINLWPDDVHSPFFPPQGRHGGGKRAGYLAVLEAMDEQLGPLFERLRNDARLRDNTVVVLPSDNGPEDGAGSSEPLRGGTTWLYEGGVRSPLIVWAPGFMAADAVGTINDTSVFCSLDLNRSLYTITDTPLSRNATVDGEDISGTLFGKSDVGREAPIFWRRQPDRLGRLGEDRPGLAARHGRWKCYVNFDGRLAALYDLQTDLAETSDVSAKHTDTVGRLTRAVLEWHAAMPKDASTEPFQDSLTRP